jgi:hypothetical protein
MSASATPPAAAAGAAAPPPPASGTLLTGDKPPVGAPNGIAPGTLQSPAGERKPPLAAGSGDAAGKGGEDPKPATPEAKAAAEKEAAAEAEFSAGIEAVKLAEDVQVAPEALVEFKALAKEHKLAGPAAQKILDSFVGHVRKQHQERQTAINAENAAWVKEMNEHPEFGGAQLEANLKHARKALEAFGAPDREALGSMLVETGLGNHPALVRMFIRIGRALGEDTIAGTAAAASRGDGLTTDQKLERALYTTMQHDKRA